MTCPRCRGVGFTMFTRLRRPCDLCRGSGYFFREADLMDKNDLWCHRCNAQREHKKVSPFEWLCSFCGWIKESNPN